MDSLYLWDVSFFKLVCVITLALSRLRCPGRALLLQTGGQLSEHTVAGRCATATIDSKHRLHLWPVESATYRERRISHCSTLDAIAADTFWARHITSLRHS